MVSKLFIEEGDYICKETGEPRNMMVVEIAYTPDGINVGWDEVNNEEEAMTLYNIERKPIEEVNG
jgi:hypothetical protein